MNVMLVIANKVNRLLITVLRYNIGWCSLYRIQEAA